MKALIISLTIILLTGAITGFAALFGVLQYPDVVTNFISNGIVGITQTALSFGLLMTLFIVLIRDTPAKLHYDQENEINNYKDKLSPKLNIVCGKGGEFQYGDSLARIKVVNTSEVTINNVMVRLTHSDEQSLTGRLPLCLHKMHDNPLDPNQPHVYLKVFTFTGRHFEYFDVAEIVLISDNNRALKITHAETLGDIMMPGKRTNLTLAVSSDTSSIVKNLVLDFDEKGRPYIDCLDEQGEDREG